MALEEKTFGSKITWEEAVRWYRGLPGNEVQIRINYFDLPVIDAAERYSMSEEFKEVSKYLGEGRGRRILDLGAGNGIASYALAKQGWKVVALEPDTSVEVGAGAIRQIALQSRMNIEVVESWGESLPFSENTFDAVFARQVLHHAWDLNRMVSDIARTLKPDGVVLSIRDHVADDSEQLETFLKVHPLHSLYGGENAFPLDTYEAAFKNAGLAIVHRWGWYDSVMNFYPGTQSELNELIYGVACARYKGLGKCLAWSPAFRKKQMSLMASRQNIPGRLYSFLAKKAA